MRFGFLLGSSGASSSSDLPEPLPSVGDDSSSFSSPPASSPSLALGKSTNALMLLGRQRPTFAILKQAQQSRAAFDELLPEQKSDIDNIPRIMHKGQEYVLEEHILGKRRGRSSWIRDKGLYLVQLN